MEENLKFLNFKKELISSFMKRALSSFLCSERGHYKEEKKKYMEAVKPAYQTYQTTIKEWQIAFDATHI